MPKEIQDEKSVLLFPMNSGRAGHFYHYMLGYLMPIVISPDRTSGRVSVVSVGLLDRITRQVLGDEVDIIPEPDITKIDYPKARNRLNKWFGNLVFKRFFMRMLLKHSMSRALRNYKHDRFLMLEPFDSPLLYRSDRISVFRDFMVKRLADRINTLKASVNKPDILLIERGKPHSYYAEAGRTSGGQRRSIPNIDSLCDVLKNHHEIEIFNLEDKDLALQIAVFSEAKVVIAQHGAALTNLIWMRPGSLVIEIIPPNKVPANPDQEFFSQLAAEMNIRHQCVLQDHEHAALTQPQMRQIESMLGRQAV